MADCLVLSFVVVTRYTGYFLVFTAFTILFTYNCWGSRNTLDYFMISFFNRLFYNQRPFRSWLKHRKNWLYCRGRCLSCVNWQMHIKVKMYFIFLFSFSMSKFLPFFLGLEMSPPVSSLAVFRLFVQLTWSLNSFGLKGVLNFWFKLSSKWKITWSKHKISSTKISCSTFTFTIQFHQSPHF